MSSDLTLDQINQITQADFLPVAQSAGDSIEELLAEFSKLHDFSLTTLRELSAQRMIDISLAGKSLTREEMIEETKWLLADLTMKIASGEIVLCSPKARNGFSRAQHRKADRANRKQLTGPRKLRTAREREMVAEKLKASRRTRQ